MQIYAYINLTICFAVGLHPDPLGELMCSPDPLAAKSGPTSKAGEGKLELYLKTGECGPPSYQNPATPLLLKLNFKRFEHWLNSHCFELGGQDKWGVEPPAILTLALDCADPSIVPSIYVCSFTGQWLQRTNHVYTQPEIYTGYHTILVIVNQTSYR